MKTKRSKPGEIIRKAIECSKTLVREAIEPEELAKHLIIMKTIELAGWGLEHAWDLAETMWRMM